MHSEWYLPPTLTGAAPNTTQPFGTDLMLGRRLYVKPIHCCRSWCVLEGGGGTCSSILQYICNIFFSFQTSVWLDFLILISTFKKIAFLLES